MSWSERQKTESPNVPDHAGGAMLRVLALLGAVKPDGCDKSLALGLWMEGPLTLGGVGRHFADGQIPRREIARSILWDVNEARAEAIFDLLARLLK